MQLIHTDTHHPGLPFHLPSKENKAESGSWLQLHVEPGGQEALQIDLMPEGCSGGEGSKVKGNLDKGIGLGPCLHPDHWLGVKDREVLRSAEVHAKWNYLMMLDREGNLASAT